MIRKIIAFLLIAVSCGIIFSTYTQLGETADEDVHVSFGMEWWGKGTYMHEPKHTPLTRIVMSAPIYLGKKFFGLQETFDSIKPIEGHKLRLFLTRFAMLPFYIFSCLLVYRWAASLHGGSAALWALASYVTLSNVSAHAGLATTDMGYAAMLLWALMRAVIWLDAPDRKNALWLGVSGALAIGSKLSALVQFPAAILLIVIAKVLAQRGTSTSFPIGLKHITGTLLYALPAMFITFLLLYRFDIRPLFYGIADLAEYNDNGFSIWLYRPLPPHGIWYFFPVVYFFKTPLTFHLLTLAALIVLTRQAMRTRIVAPLFPILASLGVIGVSMTANVNLGVRHILPVYPLLAISAGYMLHRLWQSGHVQRAAAVALLLWQPYSFLRHYPDQISYYNELGGAHPERISLDSDFDWGQDFFVMQNDLRRFGIKKACILARGNTMSAAEYFMRGKMKRCVKKYYPIVHAALPPAPTGWAVISRARRIGKNNDKFTWLAGAKALHPIGRTLDLYYIQAAYDPKESFMSGSIVPAYFCADAPFGMSICQASVCRYENRQALCNRRDDLLSGIRPQL